MRYAKEALELSNSLRFRNGQAMATRSMAIAHFFENNHPRTIEFLLLSAGQASENHQWSLEGQNYMNLGGVYSSVLGDYSKAMEYYTQALTVYEKHHIGDKIFDAYGGIAAVFIHQNEYEKALYYLKKSISLVDSARYPGPLGIVLQKMGDVYVEKKQPEIAEKYYVRSINNFKTAGNDGGRIASLAKLSDIFRQRGELDRALVNDLEALALSGKFTYERSRLYSVVSLGKTYYARHEYARSKVFFEEAIAIAQRAHMTEILKENYLRLAEVCARLNDFENAFKFQELHAVYADSVRSKEQIARLAEMEVRFEVDRMAKENEILKKDRDLTRLYVAISVLAVISIASIALLVFNRQRMKMKGQSLLAEKERELLEVELKNIQLSESQLRSEVESKNKELTTYTLNLIQKNEILEELKATLEQIKTTMPQDFSGKLNGLITSVNFSFHLDREWEGFKKHFEKVHGSFFEKLRNQFPALNTNDLKLCALLKLNLDTKEVATILGISPDSTKVARHRLRKKLNLSTEQNLTSFLTSV